MSYKNKKRKKSKLNKLIFRIGLFLNRFFNKVKKTRKEGKPMRLFGTKKVMEFLRARNISVRPNNLRINQWVDEYLDGCLINGKSVNIFTPWSLSKALEKRFEKQGNNFVPLKKEIDLFRKEMPQIIKKFEGNGFKLNWWIVLSRSYLDSRLIGRELENKYKKMIADLAREFSLGENVLFLDWEDDILGGRSAPDERILNDFDKYIKKGVFDLEFQRWFKWSKEEAGLNQTEEELKKEVKYQIACEVNEGKILDGEQSSFGSEDFILIPLEVPRPQGSIRIEI